MNLNVEKLLEMAAQLPTDGRAAFLARECPDPLVRAEVASLLQFAGDDESYFDDAIRGVAFSLRSQYEPVPGDAIGSYRILSLIGWGGMGSVYLAERADGEIQQQVAIKLLRIDGQRAGWRERFLRERQLLASLHHPSIVHVIDAGHTEDGRPFLVMEHVEGLSIDRYAAGIGVRERLELFVRVCEGVAHAHRHLIVHRDLKPSNVLVDAAGRPKLLDFGIARTLNETADATQTVERLLTPDYASPEQLRGGEQSTATDVFSLGALLYKLLTGKAPRENARAGTIAPPSRLNRAVPVDVDFVVGKALQQDPEDRYGSVDEFANDLRAVLEWRPVQVRRGDVWYRARRFLRRYWVPLFAGLLVLASLAAGLFVATRERTIAERRFAEVRQLANRLFDIEYEVRKLPGNTRTRQVIVSTALEYLRRLSTDTPGDPALDLEAGTAYLRVARVQGVPTVPNLGQMDEAEKNLSHADEFMRRVLSAQPSNATALFRSAQIAHDRMLLARYRGRYDEALALARKSAETIEKVSRGVVDKSERSPMLSTYVAIADQHARAEQFDDALRLGRRATDLAHLFGREDYLPDILWITADVHRRRGELDEALHDLDESVRLMQPGPGAAETWHTMNLALSLICRGDLLGEENGISLGRSEEAVVSLEQAFRLGDDLAHRDPADQFSRSRIANAGISMGGILRTSDPARALAIYDHTFRHVSEILNNSSFRRFEVSALAGSSYALRNLGRAAEARQRLDAAFQRLSQLGLYPAAEFKLGSEVEVSLRALADYHAGAGNLQRAVAIYQEILDEVQPKSRPATSLTDAVRISTIHRGAAAVLRRARLAQRAAAIERQDRELWQQWDRVLPNNAFVRRHLAFNGN